MKLSCADFAFPLVPHHVSLDLISAIGCEGVDVGLFENRSHLQPSDQFVNVEKSAIALKKSLSDRGLAAADIFMQADLDFAVYASNHRDAKRRAHARDLFLKTLEYTCVAGAKHVTALPGVTFAEESYEASFDRCVEEHRWRVAEAAKAGLVFGIEAHVGSIVETVPGAKALMESVPGLTLTLDYSHFVRQGVPDTEVDALLPFAGHFHARGAANGRLQTSVAENEIDFGRVINGLSSIHYPGWICLEYSWTPEWEDCGRNDNLSETVLLKQQLLELDNKGK